jgi:hypothetical protein
MNVAQARKNHRTLISLILYTATPTKPSIKKGSFLEPSQKSAHLISLHTLRTLRVKQTHANLYPKRSSAPNKLAS